MIKSTAKSFSIAVVIATKNHPELLSKSALPSVISQTLRPEYLVVVDDSSPDYQQQNHYTVESIKQIFTHVHYLKNKRTKSASGSWNTAIEFLLHEAGNVEQLFIAILDGNDTWESTYLEHCSHFIFSQKLDMVAADFYRIENGSATPTRIITEAPELLQAADFLVGNPGIQGSNMFCRIDILLSAGGFDEELQSTTEWDMCLRICDLGNVHYARLPLTLVNHFADNNRALLNQRGAREMLQGLTAFWKKYSGRMTEIQRNKFSQRALDLFDWELLCTEKKPIVEPVDNKFSPDKPAQPPEHQAFTLYVGVISADVNTLKNLLNSLFLLQKSSSIKALKVLVLDNGCVDTQLRNLLKNLQNGGLDVASVTIEQQDLDARSGAFGSLYQQRKSGSVGIAHARTMLQRYIGKLLELDATSFGWLLDDDMKVDERALKYLPWLPIFRNDGVDVLLGHYEGSSPNPPINGMRVQLVDLLHNMLWLQGLSADGVMPDRRDENTQIRTKYPDYYYDLSRKHTGHLETPYWLEPEYIGETVGEAYRRLISTAQGMLSGSVFSRPIVADIPVNPLHSAIDSVNRGGCSFILNAESLSLTPNSILSVCGYEARRSDMIWAVVNRYYRRLTIKAVGFPIQHTARHVARPDLSAKKVQAEIVGSALYAGLTGFFAQHHPNHQLNFSSSEVDVIVDLSNDYLTQRLHSLEYSFYRIRGLSQSVRQIAMNDELDSLLLYLDEWFTPDVLIRIKKAVNLNFKCEARKFLLSLQNIADDFAGRNVDVQFLIEQWVLSEEEEEVNA